MKMEKVRLLINKVTQNCHNVLNNCDSFIVVLKIDLAKKTAFICNSTNWQGSYYLKHCMV